MLLTFEDWEAAMNKACPVPTSGERQYGEIQSRIEEAMMQKVYAALQEATEQAQTQVQAAGLDMPPPSKNYFTAALHQAMYCVLCGADPETFSGGKPDIAIAVIRNSQNIAKAYWGADIEPYPRGSQGPTGS